MKYSLGNCDNSYSLIVIAFMQSAGKVSWNNGCGCQSFDNTAPEHVKATAHRFGFNFWPVGKVSGL